MPDRKKPSKTSSSKPAAARPRAGTKAAPAKRTTSKAAPAKRAAAKPAKRAASKAARPAAKTARRPAPKRSTRPDLEDLTPLDLDGIELDDAEQESDDTAEPSADVGAATHGDTREPAVLVDEGPFVHGDEADQAPPLLVRFDDREVPPPADGEEPLGVDRPREEILAGVVAALLAASVFLPWFGRGQLKISGWAAGLWGPLIFFSALAVVAIVTLRRLKLPLSLPVDHAAIIEGVGWLAVLGAVPSRFLGVEVDGVEHKASFVIFVTVVLGVVLAALASRISTGSPFVVRPGWFSGTAGKVGAAVLVAALVAGVGFGVTGTPSRLAPLGGSSAKQYTGELPPCARSANWPTPESVTLGLGFQSASDGGCTLNFTSENSLKTVTATYRKDLKANGWTYTHQSSPDGSIFTLTEPRCGVLSLSAVDQATADRSSPSKTKTQGIVYFSRSCFSPDTSGEPRQ